MKKISRRWLGWVVFGAILLWYVFESYLVQPAEVNLVEKCTGEGCSSQWVVLYDWNFSGSLMGWWSPPGIPGRKLELDDDGQGLIVPAPFPGVRLWKAARFAYDPGDKYWLDVAVGNDVRMGTGERKYVMTASFFDGTQRVVASAYSKWDGRSGNHLIIFSPGKGDIRKVRRIEIVPYSTDKKPGVVELEITSIKLVRSMYGRWPSPTPTSTPTDSYVPSPTPTALPSAEPSL